MTPAKIVTNGSDPIPAHGSNFEFTAKQKEEFRDNPEMYAQYCKDIKGELNRRFTLVSLFSRHTFPIEEMH